MIFEGLLQTQVISILQFIIVIAIGLIITKMVTDAAGNFFKRSDIKKAINRMGYDEPIIELIIIIIKYVFYFIIFIIALSQFGFAKSIIEVIIILIALFIVVLMLFGLKDFIPNASAGIYLNTFKSIKKGDKLIIGEYSGKVVDIDLMSITLKDKTGRLNIIPNSNIIKRDIIKIPKRGKK